MDKIIGFIGSGNMCTAMIGGILNSNLIQKEQIICADPSCDKLKIMAEKYGVLTTENNQEAASKADILVLSVKPQFYEVVIKEIRPVVKKDVIIVTIAAGQKIEKIKYLFGAEIKVVRVMPNTPALVGEGMSAICPCPMISPEEEALICNIFNSFGKCEIIPENLMDVVTGVSGSSPAYIFILLEAMADVAVAEGMPRDKAYKFAAQTVFGSAKMVLETNKHPGELKDMVCSPGGTTIEGVLKLEETGFRTSIQEAVRAAIKKSMDMGK